jgi:hypothetical protein
MRAFTFFSTGRRCCGFWRIVSIASPIACVQGGRVAQDGVLQYPSGGSEEAGNAELAARGIFRISSKYAPASRVQSCCELTPYAIQMFQSQPGSS